ncbi:MAG: type IX secretion system membrane protein PorP/SprF, partial [Elusimicrobiota bacterium]|nr:type IX secretion system membrane protein PorP/SprF [Elusimicrobiota bacterium]
MMRLLLALLLAVAVAPARAAFEDTGAGGRAPGLGEAFTGLADDVYAIHYNPAGLAQLERPQLGAAYSRLYVGLSDGSDIGTSQIMYAHPWARGRKGTFGFGLNRFSLGGLYTEQTIALSYARKTLERDSGSQLLTGFNFKQLSRSFSKTPEASASCSGLNCSGGADPVLSGKTSAGTMDMDLGFLYRFPRRFQLGLAIQHLMSPNVGFSGSDKLERAMNLGLAYKSLWLSLMGEIKMRKGAGGTERDMILAAERFFPTLDYGQFGVRGSLGVGANDYRQMTMGFAYRVNKVQADYAFILPVGAVKGHSGSHRVGLTFHFGAPTADEEISRELLEQAKKLRENGPDYGYEYSEELKPQTLDDPRLANIRLLISQRKYRAAHKALVEFAQRQPLSPPLIRLANRLDLVAGYFPDIPEVQTKFDTTLVASVERFLRAEDRLAMLQMSYAYSMKTEDARLNKMLDDMEKGVGLKSERLPADHPRGFMEELLYRVELANTRGDAGKVESQLMDILAIEPDNVTALLRLGSLRYVQSRYIEAIQTWEAAMPLEKRERELESLREYLRLAKERAGGAGASMPGGMLAPVVAPAPAAPTAPAPIDALPAAIDGAGAQVAP